MDEWSDEVHVAGKGGRLSVLFEGDIYCVRKGFAGN